MAAGLTNLTLPLAGGSDAVAAGEGQVPEVTRQQSPAEADPPSEDLAAQMNVMPDSELEDPEAVELWIARQEQAARLAVAAEILGSEPELAVYKQQAEQYLTTAYGRRPEHSDTSK